jgi:hypothetical protein
MWSNNTVASRPVAKLWLCKQRPLLGNIFLRSNNWIATEERCFLCGPCRDVCTYRVTLRVARGKESGEIIIRFRLVLHSVILFYSFGSYKIPFIFLTFSCVYPFLIMYHHEEMNFMKLILYITHSLFICRRLKTTWLQSYSYNYLKKQFRTKKHDWIL